MLISLLCFLAGGAIAGVVAGLLGVGGGIIIVPLLGFLLPLLGVDLNNVHHLALGTSLASIMVTSISSAKSHHKRKAVRWDIVKSISPAILIGTFIGGIIAAYISDFYLKIFFVIFLYIIAADMLFVKKEQKNADQSHLNQTNTTKSIASPWMFSGVGSMIGCISSFVGIGGGTMSVPFMLFCKVPMRIAVGTSSAIGFPIAVAGTLGYIVGGYNVANLPDYTLGYVHILAFFGLATASFFTAPIGAKLAHTLPVLTLRRIFALFLICVASRMLWNLF